MENKKLTKEEAAKMKSDLKVELAEYDANVRKYRNLWEAETDENKKAEYYNEVHVWARKANAIIKILYPHNYENECWLID